MNLKIQLRNLELLPNHEKLIDRQARKIHRLLPTFDPGIVDLNVSLEKLPRGSQFQTSLVLTIPQRAIRVEEIEENPTSSVVRAFSELRRRIKRFKSQLNRERLWRREPHLLGSEATTVAWDLETAAAESLDKLENFIRREIYHQVLSGTIPPGMLEPHAVVDEVFLKATAKNHSKPVGLSIEQWMFQLAKQSVRQRLQEVEDHRDEPHIEESVQASESEKTWEDEDLNFYQPDESLQLEDLYKDGQSSNPEEIMEQDEVEKQLQRAVAGLPETFRESFVLFALEGFTSDEVAMMTGKTPRRVVEDVEQAREILRRELE